MKLYDVQYENDKKKRLVVDVVCIVVPEMAEFEEIHATAKKIVSSISLTLGKITSISPKNTDIVYASKD